jgi:hypothetical protein
MTWDIQPGKEEEYFEFHIQRFLPSLERLGVQLSEAWLTVYGKQPRMMAEAKMSNVSKARKILNSNDWEELGFELNDFVENFNYKLIPATAGFQL